MIRPKSGPVFKKCGARRRQYRTPYPKPATSGRKTGLFALWIQDSDIVFRTPEFADLTRPFPMRRHARFHHKTVVFRFDADHVDRKSPKKPCGSAGDPGIEYLSLPRVIGTEVHIGTYIGWTARMR